MLQKHFHLAFRCTFFLKSLGFSPHNTYFQLLSNIFVHSKRLAVHWSHLSATWRHWLSSQHLANFFSNFWRLVMLLQGTQHPAEHKGINFSLTKSYRTLSSPSSVLPYITCYDPPLCGSSFYGQGRSFFVSHRLHRRHQSIIFFCRDLAQPSHRSHYVLAAHTHIRRLVPHLHPLFSNSHP